jgi:hypothetical protein
MTDSLRNGARAKSRKREPWFSIYGHMPEADHVLCGMAHGNREAGRWMMQLLENPKVTFVEILRFTRSTQTEAEIRDAIARHPPASPRLVPQVR